MFAISNALIASSTRAAFTPLHWPSHLRMDTSQLGTSTAFCFSVLIGASKFGDFLQLNHLAMLSVSKYFLNRSSSSGVVNLYQSNVALSSLQPKPEKALMNLTTRVDGLRFNHDSQLMAMFSKRNKDAFRLV
jgi:hypothetical protein